MFLLFFIIVAQVAQPILFEAVGEHIWPRLLYVRARGPRGLFVSWLAYYGVLVFIWLAVIAFIQLLASGVRIPAWQLWAFACLPFAGAAIQTAREENPTEDSDPWYVEAYDLLDRLGTEDLDKAETLDSRPTPAYLAHLTRLAGKLAQVEQGNPTARSLAADVLAERICWVKDELDRMAVDRKR